MKLNMRLETGNRKVVCFLMENNITEVIVCFKLETDKVEMS